MTIKEARDIWTQTNGLRQNNITGHDIEMASMTILMVDTYDDLNDVERAKMLKQYNDTKNAYNNRHNVNRVNPDDSERRSEAAPSASTRVSAAPEGAASVSVGLACRSETTACGAALKRKTKTKTLLCFNSYLSRCT